MILGGTSLSTVPIASDNETTLLGAGESGIGLDLNILRDRSTIVFYAELLAKKNEFTVPDFDPELPIAGQPVAASSNTGFEGFNAPEEVFRFSDVFYYPKSYDPLRPNKVPYAALINPGDVERSIAIELESESRGQTSFGELEIANPDGRFDTIFDQYNPDKRIVKVWAGSKYSDFTKFFQIAAAVASGPWYKTIDKIIIPVSATPIGLDGSFNVGVYDGQGGIGGDSNLIARRKPFLFGRNVFNITPVLINLAYYIYQVSATEISGVQFVKDQGLKLDGPYADYVTFEGLRDADIPSGYFATCNRLGLFRANFAGGSPQGLVTCDASGIVQDSQLLVNTGELVEYIINSIAGFPDSRLDLASVRELPIGEIGYYYDGVSELTVSDVLGQILRPINGYFLTNRKNKFLFQFHTDPDDGEPVTNFESGPYTENDINSMEQEENDVDPLFNLQYDYNKNWTVMTDDNISAAVPVSEKTALKSEFDSVSASDPDLQFTDASAKSLVVETFFTNVTDARKIAGKQINVRTKRRAKHIVKVKYKGLAVDPGDVVYIKHPRFAPSGRNFLVYRVVDRLEQGIVELGVYG